MKNDLHEFKNHENYDVKFMEELREYWEAYGFALINEIYVGVGINLGLSEKEAYRLAKNKPGDLQKAGFFKNIFDKFKKLFPYKVPKFRYKKKLFGSGKPMTPEQWDIFNRSIDNYWSKYTRSIAQDMGIKSYMLGRETSDFREKKKSYKNKSLYQVAYDQFDGQMPDNIVKAYKEYDFTDSEKKALNRSYSGMAMYISKAGNDVKEAIREQVQRGIDDGKTPTEVASDLYWNVQKDEELVNKYTAESMRYNWNRIATTEMASIYEAGILAPYESKAMESLKDPEKAQYFARQGGSCDWCQSKQGTIVRLVPVSVVSDPRNESLRSMGIKDPNTDIAIWIGKNNVGLKQKDWLVASPAHPHNVATFVPIDLETEFYNPKTDEVEKKQKRDKVIPKRKDYSYRSKEETESRKPKVVGPNLVQFNNNLYEAVDQSVADKKLEESRKDDSLPIPVVKGSPQYKRIFEAAEK